MRVCVRVCSGVEGGAYKGLYQSASVIGPVSVWIANHEQTMCVCNVGTKMFRLPKFYDTLIWMFASVPHF